MGGWGLALNKQRMFTINNFKVFIYISILRLTIIKKTSSGNHAAKLTLYFIMLKNGQTYFKNLAL